MTQNFVIIEAFAAQPFAHRMLDQSLDLGANQTDISFRVFLIRNNEPVCPFFQFDNLLVMPQ